MRIQGLGRDLTNTGQVSDSDAQQEAYGKYRLRTHHLDSLCAILGKVYVFSCFLFSMANLLCVSVCVDEESLGCVINMLEQSSESRS